MRTPYCSSPYQADTPIKLKPRWGPKDVHLIGVWLYLI